MKNSAGRGEILKNAARRLDVPGEAAGLPRIEIVGSSVSVENHRGILEYSGDAVSVSTRTGIVRIRGDELEICSMGADVLQVRGKVVCVELED